MGSLRKKFGVCACCGRETALTFHHLIPKKLHRRAFYRKNFTREALNQGINACRMCHDGIHDLYTEIELAKRFSTLAELLADDALHKHFAWVARQR